MPFLTVNNGTGGGEYSPNDKINIQGTNIDSYLYKFTKWAGNIQHIASVTGEATTVTMPDEDIELSAIYERAYLKIPGIVHTEAFFDSLGCWYENWVDHTVKDNKHMSISAHPDSCYLGYQLSIEKSGSYLVSSTYKLVTSKCEYLYFDMMDRKNDNSIRLGKIDIAESVTFKTTQMDTVYLAKGKSEYSLTMDPSPLKVENGWKTLYRFYFDKLNFVLIKEGIVLTVVNGDGDGLYSSGETVSIRAVTPKTGGTFEKWEGKNGIVIASPTSVNTTIKMGAGDCLVKAVYKGGQVGNNKNKAAINLQSQEPIVSISGNKINIKIMGIDKKTVSFILFDLQGKVINSVKNHLQTNTVFLQDIPHGIYLYQICVDNKKYFGKFLITE